MLKQFVNRQMIGLTLKPQDVYDIFLKKCPNKWGETKILFFVIICGWIFFFIWIKIEVEHKSWLLIPIIPKDAYTIPI
jgi:hypothetical protein